MFSVPYDRSAALGYAAKWAYSRNPAYADFADLGGDCTNFISQCLKAGGAVMQYRKTFGWYFSSLHDRSPSWSGVPYLWNFLTGNQGVGPYGHGVSPDQVQLGDIIQLGDAKGHFYHSLLVTLIQGAPSVSTISVTTHDLDSHHRPLSSYQYSHLRCLHMDGIRRT